MSKLIIRYPNNVIKEVEFDQPKYKIGSAPDNDLVLENEEVWAHQAEIDTVEGTFSIVDVSENKTTTVNGKKIERVNLNYGDRISFGPVIGLFYPSKRRAGGGGGLGGERTKLVLYFGGGGLVLIVSLVLVFYLTSRRLSNDVTRQIGGAVSAEEQVRAQPGRGLARRERAPRVRAPREGEGETAGTLEEGQAAPRVRRLGAPVLPEPTPEMIRQRSAKAIPGGVRGIFIRKEPVLVSQALAVPGPSGTQEALPQEGQETQTGENAAAGAAPTGEPATPEATVGEEDLGGENPETEAAPSEKGFFTKVTSPVARLFKGREKPVLEEALEEAGEGEAATGGGEGTLPPEPAGEAEPAAGAEGSQEPAGPAAAEETVDAAREEEIERALDPLASLRRRDVPELAVRRFKEKPVYDEREVLEYSERIRFDRVPLSDLTDDNVTPQWEYPATGSTLGGEPSGREPSEAGAPESGRKGTVFRTCAVGLVDGDRLRDVVFGTKDGTLVALSGKDGSELGVKAFREAFLEPVVADVDGRRGDEILVAFESGKVLCLGSNLEQRWAFEGRDRITSLPLFTDVNGDRTGDLVLTTLGMDLVALDGRTGFELWRFIEAENEIMQSPVGVEINGDGVDDVVFVTVGGVLHAVDGKSGWGLWRGTLSGRPAGGLAVGPVGTGKEKGIAALSRAGNLVVFSSGGKPLFNHQYDATFVTGPSLGDTDGDGRAEIVTVDTDGTVRATEAVTRNEKWRYQHEEGPTLGRLVLADVNLDGGADVLLCTYSGVLVALDGRSGTRIAARNFRDYSFATPVVADVNGDGRHEIVTATFGGKVYASQLTNVKRKFLELKKSEWYALNGDKRNTGYSPLLFFWERR